MGEMLAIGSRAQVMHGTAKKTSGGLMKKHLMYNDQGEIVSRAKSMLAKKQKHLEKAGWTAVKGKFGAVRMEDAKKGGMKGYRKGSKSKTMKGKKDFTTKKTSKVFNRRGHYQKHAKGSRKVRAPYHKKGGNGVFNTKTPSYFGSNLPIKISNPFHHFHFRKTN